MNYLHQKNLHYMVFKRTTLLWVNLIMITYSLSAQTAPAIEWQKIYGGSSMEQLWDMTTTADSGSVLVGESASTDKDVENGNSNGVAWIVKADKTGNIQWQKAAKGTYGFGAIAYTVQQTTDKGFIIAGTCRNSAGIASNYANTDFWVLKTNSNGETEWEKSMGEQDRDLVASIKQTNDGGYFFVGTTDTFITGQFSQTRDYNVIKLNSLGNIEWKRKLGGSRSDIGNSIIQTTDGGYIVAGVSVSTDGDVTTNDAEGGYWIVKLNGTGSILWQKSLGGGGGNYQCTIEKTNDGGYVLAGGVGNFPGVKGGWDCLVIKLNESGGVQWQKLFGSTTDEALNSIHQTPEGGYICGGFMNSPNGDITPASQGNYDYFVVKLTDNGEFEWQKSLGGSGYDYGKSVLQTPDGGYAVAGYTSSTDGDITNSKGFIDYWLVKLAGTEPTPVKLINISAQVQQKAILVQWLTASEINSKTYEIQRCNDGIHFVTIGIISAAGSSSAIHKYTYTDLSFSVNTINYYRLKQIDKDGSVTYSGIIKTGMPNTENKTTLLYPNPGKSFITISTVNKLRAIKIFSVDGKMIKYLPVSGNDLYNVSKIHEGIYSVRLFYQDGKTEVIPFIRQK